MDTQGTIEELTYNIAAAAIENYLKVKTEPDTFHALLDRVFPRERRTRSIMGGLETSLGTKLWERLANTFAQRAGFEVLNPREFKMPGDLPNELLNLESQWQRRRQAGGGRPYR